MIKIEALSDYGAKKVFDVPMREFSVIVTKEGYYPRNIVIFEGEKVHFFLTSTLTDPSCLTIPEKNLFMSANMGKVSEGEAYFDRPGEYKFYCPTGKIKGRVTVLSKRKKEDEGRKLASKRRKRNIVKIWRPREEPLEETSEE